MGGEKGEYLGFGEGREGAMKWIGRSIKVLLNVFCGDAGKFREFFYGDELVF